MPAKQTQRIVQRLAFALLLFTPVGARSGTITGEVRYNGMAPDLSPVIVSKDQDYCGELLSNDQYLIGSTGGLQNVVVFLETAPHGAPADPQRVNLIENNGCRYFPRVAAMQRGERLRIQNNDPKLHIPHSYLGDRTVFMLSLPFKNTALEATHKIREAGLLKLVCDTHAWMLGYVHVFDHPYFAVSDENGAFQIRNVPAGRYTLTAWHEHAGVMTRELTVSESDEPPVMFEFPK
jgi:hypothetical protein